MILTRAFKSFFGSGTAFSEDIVPKALEKIGVPHDAAGKIGRVAGTAAGIASVATGICFLIAIPMSVPMFFAAAGWLATKGLVAAVIATGFLGGVGSVVTTTGLGMCRSGLSAARGYIAPLATEKSSFDAFKTSRADFKHAAYSKGPADFGFGDAQAPSRKSANSSQLRNTASGA